MQKSWTWRWIQDVTGGEWLNSATCEGEICNICTDSRKIRQGDVFLALCGERFDGNAFLTDAMEAGAAGVICSRLPQDPQVRGLRVDDTLRAYQRLGHAHRMRWPGNVMVGVTGSFGKTSVKNFIGSVFREKWGDDAVLVTAGNTNNQIGVVQNLLNLKETHKASVLELGTSLPGEIARLRELVRPSIAVLTGIGAAHLEGLGGLEGVKREKRAIFTQARWGIVPASLLHDPIIAPALPEKVVTFGAAGENADVRISILEQSFAGSMVELTLPDGTSHRFHASFAGRHMAANAAAAAATGWVLEIDP
ncbi:MAG: hypothetical protein D6820_14015, partial [Lentisphaerae bacterium]